MIAEVATVAGAAICLTTLFNKKVGAAFKTAAVVGLVSLTGSWAAAIAADGIGSSVLGMVPIILGGAGVSALTSIFSLGGLVANIGKSKNREDHSPRP